MKKKKLIYVIIILMTIFMTEGLAVAGTNEATEELLAKYYFLLNQGDRLALDGKNQEALDCYKKALGMAQNDDTAVVARGSLLRFYEKVGDYSLALIETEWFLKRDLTLPGRQKYEETKNRLIKKIDAQKRGEKVEEQKPSEDHRAMPIQNVSDFYKADYGSQKKFLEKELPDETEILRLGKQAMLAEHAGKFAEAKGFYEQMLLQKDEAIAAFGESGWVMLYPAVQRMSELTGDEAREKEMLAWIRDHMFSDQGTYHQYLSGLLPPVQEHLKERIKKFGLRA